MLLGTTKSPQITNLAETLEIANSQIHRKKPCGLTMFHQRYAASKHLLTQSMLHIVSQLFGVFPWFHQWFINVCHIFVPIWWPYFLNGRSPFRRRKIQFLMDPLRFRRPEGTGRRAAHPGGNTHWVWHAQPVSQALLQGNQGKPRETRTFEPKSQLQIQQKKVVLQHPAHSFSWG